MIYSSARCLRLVMALTAAHLGAQTVTLHGRVLDDGTDQGIAGAAVEVRDGRRAVGSTLTDRDGRYRIDRVPRGAVTVRCSQLEYTPNPYEKEVRMDSADVAKDFRLLKTNGDAAYYRAVAQKAAASSDTEKIGLILNAKLTAEARTVIAQELGADRNSALWQADIHAWATREQKAQYIARDPITKARFGTGRIDEKAARRSRLLTQLNTIFETHDTARGLVVTLPSALFDGNDALNPQAHEALAKLTGIVLAYPGLKLELEARGGGSVSGEYNRSLSDHLERSVRDALVSEGMRPEAITELAFGKTPPVLSNSTAEGRMQSRSVQIVISGEPIGAASAEAIK